MAHYTDVDLTELEDYQVQKAVCRELWSYTYSNFIIKFVAFHISPDRRIRLTSVAIKPPKPTKNLIPTIKNLEDHSKK